MLAFALFGSGACGDSSEGVLPGTSGEEAKEPSSPNQLVPAPDNNPERIGEPLRVLPDAPDLNPDPNIVEVRLRPARHLYQVGKRTVQGYAFNGQVPGPTIRVQKGQRLRVLYENGLDAPSTVHWHGIDAPFAMDGVTWKGKPIAPGESFVYEYELNQEGTFWYHPHFDTARQVDLGLYGAVVVTDPAHPKPDYDIVMFFDVWNEIEGNHVSTTPNAKGSAGQGGHGGHGDHGGHGHGYADASSRQDDGGHGDHGDHGGHGDGIPDGMNPGKVVWSVNGQIQPKLVLPQGSSIRARMINVSNMGYLKLHGIRAQMIGSDQGLLAAPEDPEGILLTPGDRVDLSGFDGISQIKNSQYTMYGPGNDRLPDKMRHTLLWVAVGPPGTAKSVGYPFSYEKPSEDPLRTDVLFTFQGDPRTGKWSINGELFPDITIHTLPVGQRSYIELRNISGSEHPFHMHGNPFEILSIDGVPPMFKTIQDTLNVKNLQRVRIAVDANNAGDWMTHCHVLPHAEQGMMTVLRVK